MNLSKVLLFVAGALVSLPALSMMDATSGELDVSHVTGGHVAVPLPLGCGNKLETALIGTSYCACSGNNIKLKRSSGTGVTKMVNCSTSSSCKFPVVSGHCGGS